MDSDKNLTSSIEFPIVGIGASAGGLSAFEDFFSGMPKEIDSKMAFVIVQHLDPDHKSLLTELVSRYTRMKVFKVENEVLIKPNTVYIIPPNKKMALSNGTLKLSELDSPRGKPLSVDFFFESLANELHDKAIGVILSGNGTDGAHGAAAIKREGGIVLVQRPDSTDNMGMPSNAISSGTVDAILLPKEMPLKLIELTSQVNFELIEKSLKEIYQLVLSKTGHDFTLYKKSTIIRRIARRMSAHNIDNVEQYVDYLHKNSNEVEALFNDLVIIVTHFFRDPAFFEELKIQIIPALFEGKKPNDSIRVWIPGCATGEEAYSIAILLYEHAEILKETFKIQIFATDIDKRSIEKARLGIYPINIAGDLTPERLTSFFKIDNSIQSYRVNKTIRDLVIFSEQDLIKDPPFSKMDFISCRNLLIYLTEELQRKIIPMFHYSLNPGGRLFLGSSESLSNFGDLFSVIDRKCKFFQRKFDIAGIERHLMKNFIPPIETKWMQTSNHKNSNNEHKLNLKQVADNAMLLQCSSVGALVNERGDILYLYGETGKFLKPSPGEGHMNILSMAHNELKHELTNTLHQSKSKLEVLSKKGIKIIDHGLELTLNLTIRPINLGNDSFSKLFMVIFEEVPELQTLAIKNPSTANQETTAAYEEITLLKQKLLIKDEYLQSTNEELKTSNEELKSANEELQSMNEELQSTNEELQTSQEELLSINEEIATMNNELQLRINELTKLNNDMNNLLLGTGIGTIFVDNDLRILRFTPTVTNMINLIPTDLGRSITDLVTNFTNYELLAKDIKSVIETLHLKEIEVALKGGSWYLMRIVPYKTQNNSIEGAVVSFIDITLRKKAERIILEKSAESSRLALQADFANKAKSDFLANMSHEFRTPLNSILGFTEHLLESNHEPEFRDMLKRISNAGESLFSLVNNLLELTQIELGSNKLDLSPVKLINVVHDTFEILNERAERKNLSLKYEVKPELSNTYILTDKNKLQRVLLNLLSNAIKFTDHGEVKLVIKSSMDSSSSKQLEFEVHDTGIGIPQSKQHLLFQRFSQIDHATMNRNEGTGLGLSICREIVELMNGTISLSSKENEGAIFIFKIPLNEVKAGPSIDSPAVQASEITNQRLRILLADDNKENRLLIQFYCNNYPYHFDMATNGEEAIHCFKQHKYDIVIMDMQMPGVDGYEATKQIRLHENQTKLSATPIIAITGFALKNDIKKCLDCGCTFHADKPIKKRELLNLFTEALKTNTQKTTP